MQQISDLLFNTLAFVSVTIFLFATVIVLLISLRPLIRKSLFKKKIKSKEDKTSPDEIVLLIKIPPTNEQKEEAMEAFLHSLHRILSEGTHISFEMVSANQFLSFYIVVPKNLKNIIESQLLGQEL
jgi:hypothetical protein